MPDRTAPRTSSSTPHSHGRKGFDRFAPQTTKTIKPSNLCVVQQPIPPDSTAEELARNNQTIKRHASCYHQRMLKTALATAAALSLPGVALTIGVERLIRPRIFYAGPWHPEPPDSVRWPYEEAHIYTPDGLELQGWFFKQPHPSPTILFMHGTSYNASDMWVTSDRAGAFHAFMRDIRANFLVFDYRGYGQNPGTASEHGTYTDAAAALGWLYQREDVDPSQIFFYGFSLGTGVAAGLAIREPSAGLILRAPFTSVRDIALGRFPALSAPFALAPWLPFTNYDTLSKIKRYDGPLLVMHGENDQTVPESLGQRVFEAAPGAKRYVQFPAAGHSDISADLVVPHITQFIDDVLTGTLGAPEPASEPAPELDVTGVPA
jgi:pimeloyl-ACP methyl ester carboxylesterase